MTALAVQTKMLYCPKCEKTYEDGTQRFCSTEGARLFPVAEKDAAHPQKDVFTSILNRKSSNAAEKLSAVPKFSKSNSRVYSQPDFSALGNGKMFKSDEEFELELEAPVKSKTFAEENDSEFSAKVKETVAETEKATENIDGEDVFSLENPVGKIVKNRYRITRELNRDESGEEFLAEDQNESGREVAIKFLNESEDSFANKVFAAERVSLSQIKHPNVVNVLDTGELADGKPFVVTEFIDGDTIEDYLERYGQFNALRTARVVRQSADALAEVHRIGVLHRNLNPENIVLFVDENGLERVKIKNFATAQEKLSEENLLYKSPEQVEGKIANAASDNYSLAVVAYQMLTNRVPFNASSVGDLLKAQREGLRLRPSDIRFDLPSAVDDILKKALSFNSFDRYLKAADFGDEFFAEIIANSPAEVQEPEAKSNEPVEVIEVVEPKLLPKREKSLGQIEVKPIENKPVAIPAVETKVVETEKEASAEKVKATKDLAWEKRSLDLPIESSPRRNLLALLGVGLLIIALFGGWYYLINRSANTITPTVDQNAAIVENPASNQSSANVEPSVEPNIKDIEAPPLPRSIKQPPNTVYFQNNKESLKGDAMKNFIGFSLYYPNDWQVNSIEPDSKETKSRSKFLDISKNASTGTPVEQMLISYYNSKGTFKADQGTFPELVKETNDTLKKIVPNYQMVSEGQITVNNGWQSYEVKFQGTGTTANGEKIVLWGRRLFVPTAIRGMKNGYVITMLATSLSKEVQSINDVGVKGELSAILETFEPNQIL